MAEKNRYLSKVHVGAHDDHYIPVNVISESASHSMFSKLIFIDPAEFNPKAKKEWKIISALNYQCSPEEDGTNSEGCVIINFAARKVLLAGMKYAGEMKKSMFSVQNFLMPEKDVLPMHCSSNVNKDGKVSLFLVFLEQEKQLYQLIQPAHSLEMMRMAGEMVLSLILKEAVMQKLSIFLKKMSL